MQPSLYIFDLDGTLVDSAADISAAIVQVCGEFGFPVSDAEVRPRIGKGEPLAETFAALGPGCSTEPMIQRYRECYSADCARNTAPFPGVIETLEKIGPERCAVATTKKTWLAKVLIEKLGLARHFALVQGTDDFPYKPDPEIVNRILLHFGVAKEDSLMVGDTAADVLCARNAGVPCAAVLYGNGSPEELAGYAPQYLLSSFPELLHLKKGTA